MRLAVCKRGDQRSERYASFVGVMHALPGTARMSMRFTLLERLGSTRFVPVRLPGLRTWRRSSSGRRTFVYTQRVTGLRKGGAYRMRVQFRWFDAKGDLLHRSVARSAVCHEWAPLPNLQIAAIDSSPSLMPGNRTYTATVRNAGRAAARDVGVLLSVDGSALPEARIQWLGPGQSASPQFEGPGCAAGIRAIADPEGAIAESHERDNWLAVPCPAPS